jgi:hypothetical protein
MRWEREVLDHDTQARAYVWSLMPITPAGD